MRFAHLADCHLGAWRDPKLRMSNIAAFEKAIDFCIETDLDFILISGDLFNNAIPSIETLRAAVHKLKQFRNLGKGIYVIAGSHDYSASGKTILDVLEKTDLFINVCKWREHAGKLVPCFTVDRNTGAKIIGYHGRKGGLEKLDFARFDKEALEAEPGRKIFMFHSAVKELLPKGLSQLPALSIEDMPAGFDYYAGGHVHSVLGQDIDNAALRFPGPLFPANFHELETLRRGGFYVYDEGSVVWQPIVVRNVFPISIDCNGKSAEQVEAEIFSKIKDKEFNNTIVTIRIAGQLAFGKLSDIDFKKIVDFLYSHSAFFVMRNTAGVVMKDFEKTDVRSKSTEDIENEIILDFAGKSELFEKDEEIALIKELMHLLGNEREEGERVVDFENRIIHGAKSILNL